MATLTSPLAIRKRFPVGLAILSVIVVLGIFVMVVRYVNGIGAISNLSDGRPWGLWISFDLYCGVALAAGGFTLAGWVYVFNRKKYHEIARPAVLTAFLGYTLVILALLVDLGQPWYIWHAFIYRNLHSPLFEVAICVITYTIVLALEFSPAVFEALKKVRFPLVRSINWQIPLSVIRSIQIPLVIAGVVLSTLHQSSLGSMLLLMRENLSPLWYTPIMPILFLSSAVSVGPAMVIFESMVNSRAMGSKPALNLLSGLGRAIPYILGVYLILKLLDLVVRGDIGLVFTEYPQNLLWWGEVAVGVLAPMVLLSQRRIRESARGLFVGATLVVAGLIFNRFNVSMLALAMRPGYSYVPHWMEIAVSAALVADAILVIWLAYRLLPVHQTE